MLQATQLRTPTIATHKGYGRAWSLLWRDRTVTAVTLVHVNGAGNTVAAGTRLALKFGHERLRGPHPSICHGNGYDRLRGGGGGCGEGVGV